MVKTQLVTVVTSDISDILPPTELPGQLKQSRMVIKFDNLDQKKPITNRCSDSSSRDMLLRQQF